jgi:hypothetical protein
MSHSQRFTLAPRQIFDAQIGDAWPIGVRADYPEELLQNIFASHIACYVDLRSVDGVRKKYLREWNLDVYPDNIDIRVIHDLDGLARDIRHFIHCNTSILKFTDAQRICEISLSRTAFTLETAVDLAHKGCLLEIVLLVRFCIEVLAWCSHIFTSRDAEDIFTMQPQKCLRNLRSVFPLCGKYYNYLSNFTHWHPNSHFTFMDLADARLKVVYSSVDFKPEAITHVIFGLATLANFLASTYPGLEGCCPRLRENCYSLRQKIGDLWLEWREAVPPKVSNILEPLTSGLFQEDSS